MPLIESIESVGDVRSYTTIGDNNNGIADQHVISDGDIVGKYVGKLPGVGRVMDFLSSSLGFLVVIVLPMLLFFIYQIYHLIMISINLKRALAVEAAKEDEARRLASKEADDKQKEQAQQANSEAKAALEEAKRIREEAEAIRAQAQEELARAKKSDSDGEE